MPRVTKEKQKNKSKRNANKKTNAVEQKSTKDDKFSFDEEIVIGLRRIDEPVKSKENKKIKKNKQSRKKQSKQINKKNKKVKNQKAEESILDEPSIIIKSKYMSNYDDNEEQERSDFNKTKANRNNSNKNNRKKQANKKLKNNNRNGKNNKNPELSKKRRKLIFRITKIIILLGIIIGGIVFALVSPIFNIQNITVTGNSKISSETIVSLSGLTIDQNIFNFRTSSVIEGIKQNAYIDTVEVKRKFPDEIELNVQERTATYALTYGNAYVYINNQGYILEITSKNNSYPIIKGYETPTEEIQLGNRLNENDLEKLNDVLRIMEAISSAGDDYIDDITQIDISDKTNYILTLSKEKKTIYLGDATKLSDKVLWINTFLKEEEKNEGTIYLNVNLNTETPYFREKV